jgi:uncharacterized cupredoxin-like copper-binding protein
MSRDDLGWRSRAAATLLLAFAATSVLAHSGKVGGPIDYSKAKATAYGKAADPGKASRTVEVHMGDAMRYDPDRITVKRGDSVRFVVKNQGQVMHEMVLGTMKDLREHAEHMRKHPDMVHDEPNMLHVAPGDTGEMGWQFTRAGEFYYGCLVPGHFEAGMIGRITVTGDAK